ncbi:MAG: gamma-glutamyl-gamma-aminobutyrate hydrolase [Alphaproteobacteria bacterium]|nr:gamma-glutamyl-gamma-aminobutyrate hydrolase [Alphaproteobacteria bacterium]HCP00675.1 gamma-glutamyl-gamma-aminobutyrate hydrolase [Rhodospirillaceae bacterium]
MPSPDTIRPLIGVNADVRENNGMDFIHTGMKYITAVIVAAGGIPVLIPSLGDVAEGGVIHIDELICRLDGLVLTGGRSNVEPHNYGGEPFRPETLRDPLRDATTLPLARKAIEAAVPLFGICRGIQEINVALGGSLHPYLWELDGVDDHRMPQTDVMANRFAIRHPVTLRSGGVFAKIARDAGHNAETVMVNSLHGQAINKVADGLRIEAVSHDGVIEGVSMPDSASFMVGVQWHAEYRVEDHAFNRGLFRAFGQAARSRAASRAGAPKTSDAA